jgi:hypothetical protein
VFGSGPVAVAVLLAYRHLWSDRLRPVKPIPLTPQPALGE